MALAPGTRLGPYEILTLIGAGGMGEVYRAHDTRLRRDVAIKVSAERFSERFEKEARAIASLNHPNVCTLYDVGSSYLVMELVEGRTLAQRIKESVVPLDEALAIAQQIADALEAAHRSGITHRDLKPGNINIKPDGTVKVLDFGLAKMGAAPLAQSDNSPTLTAGPTQTGMILGTAAYMSPEQARGKLVDSRTDIWAFGVVLYEMLTGDSLFKGEDASDTLAAIIKHEPDLTQAPLHVRKLLRACLTKDPSKRLRDIADWRLLLDDAAPSGAGLRPGRSLWPLAAVLATLALAVMSLLYFRESSPISAAPIRFQIPAPDSAAPGSLLTVSPDGRKVAFIAGGRLWVHFLESGQSRDLTEAYGTPFWSTDSRFIGYPIKGKLKRIEATGGLPQTVADYRGLWGGGAWNRDDLIVFSVRTDLLRVPAAGGVPVAITTLDRARHETLHYAPSFLPDGQHFVYTRRSLDESKSVICLGSVDAKPDQQGCQPLVNSFWGPQYVPSLDLRNGYLLFMRDETLLAQPFDNRRLALTGAAVPVAEQIIDGRAFSSSNNGVLVFQRGSTFPRQLTWYDRRGEILGTTAEPSEYYRSLALSPDGTRAALTRNHFGQASSIWLLDLTRGTSARLASGSASDVAPIWSPDGSRLIYSSNRDGSFDLYQEPSDAAKPAEVVFKSPEDKIATTWSRDGRFLMYTVLHPVTGNDIWVLPLEPGKKPVPFLVTEFNETSAAFSPDGHWVAYVSDESGQTEVYVRSFSMNSAATAVNAEGKWLISSGGGVAPKWRGDGGELYYQGAGGKLMAVEIMTKPVFRAGAPRPSELRLPGAWDSSPDGKRFLAMAIPTGKPELYTVVVNWQAGLKK